MDLGRGTTLRRLHAISGLVPVGAFLVFHLYVNAWASRGRDAYDAAVRRLQQAPLAGAAEILLILLPLIFHGVVGLFVIASLPPAAERRGRAQRALAVSQRVTGVYLFGFLLFHLWTTRLVQLSDHADLDLYRLLQATLASPWIRLVYVVGVLAASFHLAAGLWSLAALSGRVESPLARGGWLAGAAALFLTLAIWGLSALSAFRL